MASRYTVAVLTHARDRLESERYLLNLLIEAWRRSGIEVLVLRGPDTQPRADALVLHVDLTVIPREYLAVARRYPMVVNGRVLDISKRRISTNLVRLGEAYAGEVIVKSNRNAGGFRERMSTRSRLLRKLNRALPWTLSGRVSSGSYPVFPSPAAVPLAAWLNPLLVVEKFLPEREGKYYCLRQWAFFGEREANIRVLSAEPVIKARKSLHREYDLPVPEALRAMRAKLGFDYGKFDYVLREGEVVLLDANRTPFLSPENIPPRLQAILDDLAQGLYGFLAARGAPLAPATTAAPPVSGAPAMRVEPTMPVAPLLDPRNRSCTLASGPR